MSKTSKRSRQTPLRMSAVIICNDFAFRATAAETLARVGQRKEVNVEWNSVFWPMNALNDPELGTKALMHALDAHLILFSGECVQALPKRVFDWLNDWAAHRTIPEAALGIMAHHCTEETATPAPLLDFARRHGLHVLVDSKPEVRDLFGRIKGAPPRHIA